MGREKTEARLLSRQEHLLLAYRTYRACIWARRMLWLSGHVAPASVLALAGGALGYYGLGYPQQSSAIVFFNAAVAGINGGVSLLAHLAVRYEGRMRRRWVASERLRRRHLAQLSGGSNAP